MDRGLEENPVRIVVDSKARTPEDADIFKKGSGKRMIIVSESAPSDRVSVLAEKAEIIVAGKDIVDLTQAMEELKTRGIKRMMLEGGATLNWGMFSAGLVDEIYTFVGNLIIGGKDAPTFVDGDGFLENAIIKLELINAEKIEEGMLLKWKVHYDK
jgi:2,5-diamino-6-(ribosylamino)-4(3H)-pyrimidinone 5'-phosphate reductase